MSEKYNGKSYVTVYFNKSTTLSFCPALKSLLHQYLHKYQNSTVQGNSVIINSNSNKNQTQKPLAHFHSTDCKSNEVLTFIMTYEEKKMLWQQRVSRHFHNHRLTLWKNVVWKLTGDWDSSSGLEQYGKFVTTFGFCTVNNAATRTNRTVIVSLPNVLHKRVKGDKILREIKDYNWVFFTTACAKSRKTTYNSKKTIR